MFFFSEKREAMNVSPFFFVFSGQKSSFSKVGIFVSVGQGAVTRHLAFYLHIIKL